MMGPTQIKLVFPGLISSLYLSVSEASGLLLNSSYSFSDLQKTRENERSGSSRNRIERGSGNSATT